MANIELIIVALGVALGVAIYLALAGVGKAQSFEQTKLNQFLTIFFFVQF